VSFGAGDAIRRALERLVGPLPVDPARPLTWDDVDTGWEIITDGCCPACDMLHGRVFATQAALERVMPLGGPNPACELGGGCVCRTMPIRAG